MLHPQGWHVQNHYFPLDVGNMVPSIELSVLILILVLPAVTVAPSVVKFTSDKNHNSYNGAGRIRWGARRDWRNVTAGPQQCQRVACPPYTLQQDRGTYELRYYPVAPYAKSQLVGHDGFLYSTLSLYSRLHDYFHRHNDKEELLPMTAPVILRMDVDDEGLWAISNYTMFFYIDPSVKSPPTPSNDQIKVVDVNAFQIYIRTFPGYAVTYGDWVRELLALRQDLEADGQPYVKSWFYFASYDSPLTMSGRVNEVQFLKPHNDM